MENAKSEGMFGKFISWIEKAGNALPQPVTLFAWMVLLVLIVSFITGITGWSAVHPGTGEEIFARNLLSSEGIRRILTEMVPVFTSFPPLGLVLVVMLGIGMAERSGLISAALKAFVASIPNGLMTFALVTAGMMSSLAADAGYVVLVPLGAVIFHGMGRHPIAGLAAAFAGVSGGFSANLILTSLDPLLSGITELSAQLEDPLYRVDATANYYLMVLMVPVFAIAGTFVTEKIVEPRLGKYVPEADTPVAEDNSLTKAEKKGLIWAGVSALVLTLLFLSLALPQVGVLRNEAGELRPFFDSIVVIMLFVFFVPGLVYGRIVKTVRNEKDVSNMLGESMASMGAYIVLAFVAAQFVAYFDWSNIGRIVAIKGASGLEAVGFTGAPLIIAFMMVSSVLNLLIGSASAKWAIMGPVFVPMLMQMGYSPELTQAAYRLGDSFTNILTPLLPYFPIIIIFAQKYKKDVGIGTLISVMVPFSIAFCIMSVIMILIWMTFGLPLGPDAPLHYIPATP